MAKKENTESHQIEESESNNLVFTLSPVKEKPKKNGSKKASKYDIILDTFMENEDKLFEIRVEGKNIYYLKSQLKKRIEARKLKKILVFILNNQLFLEKE